MSKSFTRLSFPLLSFVIGSILTAACSPAEGQHTIPWTPTIEARDDRPLGLLRRKWPKPAVVSLESVNYRGRFLRHRGYRAILQEEESSRIFIQDSSFLLHAGLAGRGVSFESVNFPGYFLKLSGRSIVLRKNDHRRSFAEEASFRMMDGLAGQGISLQPIGMPGHFVRHYGHRFIVSKYKCQRLFHEDASLILRQENPGSGHRKNRASMNRQNLPGHWLATHLQWSPVQTGDPISRSPNGARRSLESSSQTIP